LPGSKNTRPLAPFTLAAAALWVSALWFLEHVCFDMTEAARPGAATDIVSVTACVVLATSAVVFGIVRVHAPEESLREVLGVEATGPLSVLLAAVAGAGLAPVLSTVEDLIAQRWPYDDPEAAQNVQALLSSSTRFALVASVFLIIPLAQEVFFRGILFGELERNLEETEGTSLVPAIVATSLLFAVFSLDWRAMPTALVLGLALGWMRARTNALVAPVAAHLAYCAVEGLPILRGADPSDDIVYSPKWIAAGAAATTVALALMAIRKASRA
jgi:membrane protease YdiL (CAAX protease family)